MSEAILGVMFVIIAVLVLVGVVIAVVEPIYLQEEVATENGVIIEVNSTEYQDASGVTTGGNTTVLLLDNLWLSITGLLGTIGGFFCGAWALAALAFGLAMLGFSK